MTLYKFMMLDVYEQASELFENAIMVISLYEKDANYDLYSLGSIFVEIKRNKTTNKIMETAIFKSGIQLDKYFGSIDIINGILAY